MPSREHENDEEGNVPTPTPPGVSENASRNLETALANVIGAMVDGAQAGFTAGMTNCVRGSGLFGGLLGGLFGGLATGAIEAFCRDTVREDLRVKIGTFVGQAIGVGAARWSREEGRAVEVPKCEKDRARFADCQSDDDEAAGDGESQRGLCCVCLNSRACVVFKPCRHLATCRSCLHGMKRNNVKKCPLCNALFSETEVVFTT